MRERERGGVLKQNFAFNFFFFFFCKEHIYIYISQQLQLMNSDLKRG